MGARSWRLADAEASATLVFRIISLAYMPSRGAVVESAVMQIYLLGNDPLVRLARLGVATMILLIRVFV